MKQFKSKPNLNNPYLPKHLFIQSYSESIPPLCHPSTTKTKPSETKQKLFLPKHKQQKKVSVSAEKDRNPKRKFDHMV